MLLVIAAPGVSHAQGSEPLKPYVVLAFDTSGSMSSSTGSGPPSCGGNDTRLDHARCAVNNIVNSYGEMVFALARFRTTDGGTTTASTFPAGCCANGPDVAAGGGCSAGPVCNATSDMFEMLTGLVDGANQTAADWVNFTGNTCTDVGTDPEIWAATGNTPLEGTLRGAKRYWLGLQDDGVSTPTFNIWPAGNPGFDPIRNDPTKLSFLPSGCNPSPSCTTNCCATQCRPYIVILLTDGAETCGGNPPNGASALLTTDVDGRRYRVETKPIGFGIAAGNAQIEAIAQAGGEPNGAGNEGFYANNEAELQLAISNILADAIKTESCNNLDDDCDTQIDEDFPNKGGACDNGLLGVCRTTGTLICRADGAGLQCNAPAGPSPSMETCNQLDDDCDGKVDEGLGSCTCVPQGEQCNNMDDDCDTNVDEGLTRQCGTGTCVGTETCAAGMWGNCTAQQPTTETCNGDDDNCDGVIDGLTEECSNLVTPGGPATDNPGGNPLSPCSMLGAQCICHPGMKSCPAGGSGTFGQCVGEQGPLTEVCNNLDDDCDGTVDEGTGGADCSTNCGIGVTVCVNGQIQCTTTTAPDDDTCDGVDDDCDGMVDEDWVCTTPPNCPCTAQGICGGVEACVGGQVVCNGMPTSQESCNCDDDDCDNVVDEGNLCPPGATCTDCQCAFNCTPGEFPCPTGKYCKYGPDSTTNTDDFCVADPCFGIMCPDDAQGDKQVCIQVQNGYECVDICSQVSCNPGQVCIGSTGECKADDCTTFPERCAANQNCVNGVCVTDPCQGVTCPAGQYCSSGTCIGSCSDIDCPDGERCRLGQCEPDPCGKQCPAGQACNDATGECVTDPCLSLPDCPQGQDCNPNNGGACEDSACVEIDYMCPNPMDRCLLGTCFDPQDFAADAGVEERVTTGGGGGCSASGGASGALFAGLLALVLRRRRPRATREGGRS